MTKLAEAIAHEEGFGIPGTMPTRQNNPGDLRHAPGEFHQLGQPNAVGSFDSADEGWKALERQLELYAERNLTLEQAIYEFAPPSENNSSGYLQYVCNYLGVDPSILVADALKIPGDMVDE